MPRSSAVASSAAMIAAQLSGNCWRPHRIENMSKMDLRIAVTLTVATSAAAMSGTNLVNGEPFSSQYNSLLN